MVAAPPDEAADDAVDGAVDDEADVAGDEGTGGIAVEAVARSDDDPDVGRVAFLLECEEQALDISPTKPTVATATATRRESHILRITARG